MCEIVCQSVERGWKGRDNVVGPTKPEVVPLAPNSEVPCQKANTGSVVLEGKLR